METRANYAIIGLYACRDFRRIRFRLLVLRSFQDRGPEGFRRHLHGFRRRPDERRRRDLQRPARRRRDAPQPRSRQSVAGDLAHRDRQAYAGETGHARPSQFSGLTGVASRWRCRAAAPHRRRSRSPATSLIPRSTPIRRSSRTCWNRRSASARSSATSPTRPTS